MILEVEARDLVVAELQIYEEVKGKLFSSELAKRGRATQTLGITFAIWILGSKVIDKICFSLFSLLSNFSTFYFADAWWQSWGGNTSNLKKFSLKILCQPCSSSNCEHNWSLLEAIHTKKRNKLAKKRLNDLFFVQYNLWLRIRKAHEEAIGPIDLDDIDPYSDWTSQEKPPLFTEDDVADLERQAMEEGGGFGFTLDDIEERRMSRMRSHCQC